MADAGRDTALPREPGPAQRSLLAPRQLPASLVVALAALIAVLAWPPLPFRPIVSGYFASGLDFSWQVALHLAAVARLQWGSDVLFTYGPLGFLSVPVVGLLVSPYTAALGLLFAATVMTALAAMLLLSLQRWLPLPLAWVAALGAVALVNASVAEAGALAGLLLVGLALGGGLGARASALVPALVAGLAALLLLVKASAGSALGVAVPLVLIAEPRELLRRGLGAAAAFLGVLAVAWLAAGQSLAGLPGWLHGALLITSGYSEAMAIDEPTRHWEYPALAGYLAAFALAFAAGVDRRTPRRIAALAAVLALAGFVFTKAGFVRHAGAGHPSITFSFLLIAPLMVPWRPSFRPIGLGLAVVAGVLLVPVRGVSPVELFDPVSRTSELYQEVSAIARPQVRHSIDAISRAGIRRVVQLPPHVVAELRGRRVHVDPDDVGILWAYDLAWAPVPVFQSYSAYTPELDRMNAQRLEDPRGPDRILRRRLLEGLDGRSPLWETPEYALARLCRYREIAASELWQVLARGPDRCGPEVPLGTASVAPGAPLSVPVASVPNAIVVAHVDARRSLAERLRTALFKPRDTLYAVVDGQRERLVPANLGGPLLMRIPATSDWSRAFDGGLSIESFAIEGASAPIGVRFAEIPLAPPTPD